MQMGKGVDLEQKNLINELTKGKESAKRLRNHLNPSSPPEARQILLEKILSSYEKALTILNYDSLVDSKPTITIVQSPHNSVTNNSPTSDVLDQAFQKNKRRKTQPRWTEQVKVCSSGSEGSFDDGYSWRKYGQKDILGANHPRGYYRCTHRHSRGCLAVKQVQRSDTDPSIMEITYRGRHTCTQTTNLGIADNKSKHEEKAMASGPGEMFCDFGAVKVEMTEDTKDDIFRSVYFSFKSMGNENDIFKESMVENDFLGCLSPMASESNYFSVSPSHMNDFGVCYNIQTPESQLNEIISAPTSVTNSPTDDLGISIENVDFDTNFTWDNPEYFA